MTSDEPGPGEPVDALGRMDAFARRVGFSPTRLPRWLQHRDERPGPGEHRYAQPGFTFSWPELLPPVTLYLHVAAEDLERGEGGVVRWEGEGPVTHQYVQDHLRPLHRYVIAPVIDLAHMAPVDAYEIPDRHRRAVRLRTPADCFPRTPPTRRRGSTSTTARHTHASTPSRTRATDRSDQASPGWRTTDPSDGSTTGSRPTATGRCANPFPGIYLWRDPHGQIYLVDHTGSHKVTRPAALGSPAET